MFVLYTGAIYNFVLACKANKLIQFSIELKNYECLKSSIDTFFDLIYCYPKSDNVTCPIISPIGGGTHSTYISI
jgi:hypothetical protein